MDKIFGDALGDSTIRSTRLSEQDLMERVSRDGLNVVQLCMSASTLQLEPFKDLLCGGKYERIELIDHLVSKSTGSLMACTDCYGMTVMHAASLLLQGVTPSRALTPQEMRSKRVKTYPSVELKLLDAIRGAEVGVGLNLNDLMICLNQILLHVINGSIGSIVMFSRA